MANSPDLDALFDLFDLFDLLDRWRHRPAYQLERRADLFFALFLPQVLEAELGVTFDPRLVPEFPLKQERGLLSDKVDYLAVSEDRSRAVLVELKTDMGSIDSDQLAYLRRAVERGASTVLAEVVAIFASQKKKSTRRKYFHLLSALRELGLLEFPETVEELVFAPRSQGLTQRSGEIRVREPAPTLEIVYVLPRPDATVPRGIHFEDFARHIEGQGVLADRFARSLREWATSDAGATAPTTD